MHYLLLFTCFISTLLTAVYGGCGQPVYPQNTESGDAFPHSWPWQVSLQYESGGDYIHTCGGTLIDRFWVLTAAHCILSCRNYRIVLGKHDLSAVESAEKIIPVQSSDIHIHDLWKPGCLTCGNDIALIKLPEKTKLTDEIQLGCLPGADQILTQNHQCFITGWGKRTPGVSVSAGDSYLVSDTLQQALLPFVKPATCPLGGWWEVNTNLMEKMICAGDSSHPGCIGDSGGPLNCRKNKDKWLVYGITSFFSTEGCNAPNKPTVFTRVSDYVGWIDEIITLNP